MSKPAGFAPDNTGTVPSRKIAPPGADPEGRDYLEFDEGIGILDGLFADLRVHEEETEKVQFRIGEILWRMDPQTDQDWDVLAKRYGKSVSLLKVWLRTASRLRSPRPGMSFAAMAELARIPDGPARDRVLALKPAQDWTQASMRAAVNRHLYDAADGDKRLGRRPQTKAGCQAYLDEDHVVRVSVRLTESFAEIEVNSTLPLEDGEIHSRNPQRQVIEFSW